MATQTIQLIELVDWSDPKRVETKQGPRMLRKAVPTEQFWTAWRQHKDVLKQNGISVSRTSFGLWEVCWWLPLDDAEQEKVDQALEASRATDADVEIPKPDGLEYLPYQKAGIKYAAARRRCLIADEMGLGKTIQGIGVWNLDDSLKTALVICPASLRINWKREFLKWTTRKVSIAVVDGGSESSWLAAGADGADVVIINWDVLHRHHERILQRKFDLLIADEAHYGKNPKNKRTRALHGHTDKDGKIVQLPISARRELFLTGTPILNRPVEAWSLVQRCDPEGLGRNFFYYGKKYCAAHHNGYGYGWSFKGASNTELLQRLLRERFMVRRLKADVLKELPPKRYQVVEVPCPDETTRTAVKEQAKKFKDYIDYVEEVERRLAELEAEYGDDAYQREDYRELRKKVSEQYKVAFEETAKERKRIGVAKIGAACEMIEAAMEEGPVIVFGWHTEVIDAVAEHFKGRAGKITGETPMEQRQDVVDAFQSGKIDLFVGNYKAAGVGLTLTRSSHVMFIELSQVPADMTQAADRAHRIGQTESVLVQYLVLEDSIDAYLADMLIKKQKVCDAVLDDKPTNGQAAERTLDDTIDIELKQKRKQQALGLALEIDMPDAMPQMQKDAIHLCLRRLAGLCDGARAKDDCGFNANDTRFGKELARTPELTDRQAGYGLKMILKYHRQLPSELLAVAKGATERKD